MADKQFNLTIRINGKEVKNTINGVGKELRGLRAETRNLTEGTEEYEKKTRELAKAEKRYDDLRKKQRELINETKKSIATTDDQIDAMDEFGQSFSEAFQGLKNGDLVAFRAGMAGVTRGIGAATKAAWSFIATPLGATIAALAGIALAAREWFRYNEEAAKANLITQQITKLSGEALDQARVRAKSLEKTFGTDFKENLTIAKSLVQAFGISYEEAFDRIEDGLIRGGQQNDEFLKSLKEYPKLFAQAGFTVEEFQRIVNTGIDLGVYDDKLPDAIKEFSLSIMEQTTTVRDALENAFGKQFTDNLFANINNGSITVKDALALVSEEAERIGLNAQQSQQLTADLFRGAGEDAGGAQLIFEAVNQSLNDQVRELTPLEAQLKKVADANERLEKAQNAALKSDQYAAFANDIEVAWTNFKAFFFESINDILEGFSKVDTGFRKFVFTSVQGIKNSISEGSNLFDEFDKAAEEFDKKQKAREKAASEKKKQEQEQESPENKAAQEAERKRIEEQDRLAKEAEDRRRQRIADLQALEKKRLQDIDALEEEYARRSEDRAADTTLKKIELDRQRELAKAESLRAGQEVIDQINADFDAKAEEERLKQEEKKLEDIKAFEERKQALLDEIELAKKETEQEKEQLREEQRYEKEQEEFERQMERLQLTTEEKQEVERILTEKHEQALAAIREKANQKKQESDRELHQNRVRLINDSLDAAINAAGAETKVGQALLLVKQIMAAKEMAVQLGLFKSKMALNVAEATGDSAKGLAKTTASAPFPANIPLIIGFAAQIAGIIGAIKNAAGAGKKVKTSGFAKGGPTDMFGMGYTDESGHEVAGVVHTKEYVIPEFVRKLPGVAQIEKYLEGKRRQKLGLYAEGGGVGFDPETDGPSGGNSPGNFFTRIALRLLEKMEEPWVVDNYFGYEAEEKRKEAELKLQKIKDRSKIKKTN